MSLWMSWPMQAMIEESKYLFVWTRYLVWAMSVVRKHLCGQFGLYRPRQRKENVCWDE